MTTPQPVRIDPEACEAVVFDMDGVLTDTARVHARAWKETFDELLEQRSRETGAELTGFDIEKDYPRFVDGVPRYDGVRRFLAARGIGLEEGDPADAPGLGTVHAVGNLKNQRFLEALRRDGAEAFPDAVALIRGLRRAGIRTAVFSASRNARAVLEAAGIADLFDARVDGGVRTELGLPGKPAPDVLLEAARRLDVPPARAAVVEDAVAGIEAARAGGFARAIGVARGRDATALWDAGADAVVEDLSRIELRPEPSADADGHPIASLPSALERLDEILGAAEGRQLVVLLDFDGTLAPIADRPEEAHAPDGTREALRRLAAVVPVAVVSGRDLGDLRERLSVDTVTCAGSHGFELATPDGGVVERQEAEDALPALARAGTALSEATSGSEGVQIERKRFGLAVHYRRAGPGAEAEVREAVERVASQESRLRVTEGRKVLELRPAIDWDKGRAVPWILEALGLEPAGCFCLYLGDDLTDEDAFRALEEGPARGRGIVVHGREGRTRTRYALEDPEAVRRFLEALERKVRPE